MTTLGLITGSGFYELDTDLAAEGFGFSTPWGDLELQRAEMGGHTVIAVPRHGRRHERLSNQVRHRANLWALHELGAGAVVGSSVVGVLDPEVRLATPILFDELYFPSNRLPDGTLATFFEVPGDPARGHLILASPFSPGLRAELAAAAASIDLDVVPAGCYAHVDGPRFNTRTEVAALRSAGCTALSQTCGPEAVLAAELELPYVLVGFGVDYANGVVDPPTTRAELSGNLARHGAAVTGLLSRWLEDLREDAEPPFDTGFVFRMEQVSS